MPIARESEETADLEPGHLDLGPARRTFSLVPASQPRAPLLVVLHGLGMTGRNMAALTGLARRGPEAGFAVAFPDAWEKAWDPGRRLPGREGIDDPGFLRALAGHLADRGTARPDAVFLVGASNGALCAEHVARHGLVPVSGIVLVSGATTKASRDASRPARPTAVLCIEGTADPIMPYWGGPIGGRGLVGLITARRARERGETGESRIAVAAETVARDWAVANRLAKGPVKSEVGQGRAGESATDDGDLPVTRLTWSVPGHKPVVLYRIEGGGHGWPGGAQPRPAGLFGRISRLDATGLLLDTIAREC